MALILSIETSVEGCSVALHVDGKLLSNVELFAERSAAEMLTTAIGQNLQIAGKGFDDLDAIAICKGPGSYTGLRIGVSTAKGLCFAKDLPLVSVNSLDVMIAEIQPFYPDSSLVPMLDARRMEVYTKVVKGKSEVIPTSAVIIEDESFKESLEKGETIFFGPGAAKCKEVFTHKNAVFPEKDISPKASSMGQLAFEKFEAGAFENVAEFEPFYLKEFMGTKPTKNKKVVAS
ncbi:tRNA (adenosine(37)-N6)-threonylcarbamoyltransferase complex dimerization subunit type 1 TsaB [Jiulongibacter sediminis]|uniref:tRNA (adenosine(37)-N6)-threonylcarbamoyltransferase complex dimerization subunit type 1 TsaB n=1 Tax=Jiulongibacter sediminis TaxID=1605367 RepID=UPI0026EA5045|nr:tRNA (adenosine(37)-N6)-threonylcarbamoyltransferase complex dimerization subunit type 1 TsaB [Jiulongibacter sediminis]